LLPLLAVLWLIGCAWAAAPAAGLGAIARHLSPEYAGDAAIGNRAAGELSERAGLLCPPEVRTGDVPGPVVIFPLRPTIILPANLLPAAMKRRCA